MTPDAMPHAEPEAPKICWVVTGAGHFLREVSGMLPDGAQCDLYLTRAALEVCARYRVKDEMARRAGRIHAECDYSGGQSVYFSSGRYSCLVIAPATSNTVAKCVLGIADSLATVFFAQAGKSRVPILVLPTDVAARMRSVTPSGKTIDVSPRPIDLLHTQRLSEFPGVVVVKSVAELGERVQAFSGGLA